MSKPTLRIQKSKNGKFVMFVLVVIDSNDKKHQKYFSVSLWQLARYIAGKSESLYINAPQMFTKADPEYEEYLKEKKRGFPNVKKY